MDAHYPVRETNTSEAICYIWYLVMGTKHQGGQNRLEAW